MCIGFIFVLSFRSHFLKYQKQISKETDVAKGGAKPIQKSDVGSIWLNDHDSGMRNRNVAMRLCTMGNHELPCPLK